MLDLVREALDADQAPVISLLCTDQAATDRSVAAKKRDDDDDDDDDDEADAGALADTCAAWAMAMAVERPPAGAIGAD